VAAGAQVQQRERGGIRRHQRRGKLAGREIPAAVTIEMPAPVTSSICMHSRQIRPGCPVAPMVRTSAT
jgi:hypothetical protein